MSKPNSNVIDSTEMEFTVDSFQTSRTVGDGKGKQLDAETKEAYDSIVAAIQNPDEKKRVAVFPANETLTSETLKKRAHNAVLKIGRDLEKDENAIGKGFKFKELVNPKMNGKPYNGVVIICLAAPAAPATNAPAADAPADAPAEN